MKFASSGRQVVSTATEANSFTIKADAKAFGVLRDSLYTDKPLAIVRETFTNAYDAHLAVGKKDVPFEVILPSAWEPTFRVRDFGPGMPHEFMMGNYTVAFHSEKDDSNSQVGGFGLGRMSAFSYTDNYSVITYRSGVQRAYSIMINEESVPEVNFLGETPTEEPDGTEVTFPITTSDTKLFAEAMKKVSFGFDVKPEVAGDFEWPDLELITEGDRFKLYETEYYSSYYSSFLPKGVYARMGCVLYPIDQKLIGETLLKDGYYNSSKALVLDFPIGSLSVIASREALSYGRKERTIPSVKHMFNLIRQDLMDDLAKALDDCESFQEAFIKAPKIRSSAQAFSLGDNKLTWNGETISNYYEVGDLNFAVEHGGYRSNRIWWDYRSSDLRSRINYSKASDIKTVLVIDQIEKKVIRRRNRITNYVKDNNLENQTIGLIMLEEGKDLKLLQEFMSKFPDFDYVSVNDLTDPGATKTGVSKPVQCKELKYGYHHGQYSGASYLKPFEMSGSEFDKGGYYFPLYQNEVDGSITIKSLGISRAGRVSSLESWKPYWLKARKLDDTTKIVGVPRTIVKRFKDNPKWLNVLDLISDDLDKRAKINQKVLTIQKLAVDDHVYLLESLDFVDTPELSKMIKMKGGLRSGPFMPIFSRLVPKDDTLEETFKTGIEKHVQNVYTKYPLLRLYSPDQHTDFKEYVQLMDKKFKEEKSHELT